MSENNYLENDHSGIVTGGKDVEGRMSSNNPKSVVLSSEGVQARALGHVPNPDGLVLRVGHDQVLTGMENHAGYVVVVATASVNLPGLKMM